LLKCEHCGYEWEYKGKLARASCPSCGQKVKSSRRGVVLGSPLRAEPPPEPRSAEASTIGQEIDDVLDGLTQEEHDRLREILVPQARQLAQLIRFAKRGDNEAK
jgi:hypothetical protein